MAAAGTSPRDRAFANLARSRQEKLEKAVIDAVLKFYEPYLSSGGRKRLEMEIRQQLDSDGDELAKTRKRTDVRLGKISSMINQLLDDITAANRELVDRRLGELGKERETLEAKLEQVNSLTLSLSQVQVMVDESVSAIGKISQFLRMGVPEEQAQQSGSASSWH